MIDVEPLIVSELNRLVPLPASARADWQDVLDRAGVTPRRRLVVALAAFATAAVVAVTTPIGSAIAQGLGDFSDWLTGHPGKPASSADQRAFDAVNERWPGFPTTTKLRELIRTNVGGKDYVLLGFRSGNTLCLQLNVPSLKHGQFEQCLPASHLTHVSAPAIALVPGWTFQDTRAQPASEVSFGLVASGVSRVSVEATDGMHSGLVASNAYLVVENQPNTANKFLRLSVVGGRARRSSVSLAQFSPLTGLVGTTPKAIALGGPTLIQARIAHPTVAWVKSRAGAPHHVTLTPAQRASLAGQTATRPDRFFVKPDPLSSMLVGFDGDCLFFSTGGQYDGFASSCGGTFSQGPLWFMGSDSGLAGAAADGVARVKLFLANGEQEAVRLRDNLFTALLPSVGYPAKLVAYDARNRVVDIQRTPPFMSFFELHPVPRAAQRLREVLTVTGPNRSVATLRVGPTVRGFNCWRVNFSTGQIPSACIPPIGGGPKIWVDLVQPSGHDLFVVGRVDAKVTARVEFHFANGDMLTTHPVVGHFVFAIPKSHLSRTRQSGYVLAVDHQGHRVQRQGVVFRTN